MDDRSRKDVNETRDPVFLRTRLDPGVKAPAAPGEDAIATKRSRSPVGSAVFLLLIALIGYGTWRFVTADRTPPARPDRAVAAQPVGAATIATADIRVLVNGLGAVTPLANVTVKTQINGQLIDVAFKEGQLVKKGDVLAQIDPRPYQYAEAQFEGQLLHDQGLLDQARSDMTRYQTLLKQDSIARQTADNQVFLVKQYEGSVKSDQAQIDAQKLNLTYARIVSPIDGRVGLRMVDAGNYVQTSDAGIAVLTQLHPISVIFTLPEDDLPPLMAQMKAGNPLEVTIFDRSNTTKLAVGKVTNLDNQIDATTGTVKLRAEFPNLDDALFPNQFVNASLLIKTLKGAVAAPLTAIQRGAPGTYVYLIGADNKVTVRKVELGPQDGDKVAILSGVAPGDRVVVDGADRLREGAEVFVAASDGVASTIADPTATGHRRHRQPGDSGPPAPPPQP